ncbi:hypothetical protein CPU12_04400 [Malaciobacter molluscorum LMG 25693]|uniref:CRISPR/Cas system-associated RAMP protein Cas6, type III n=1 Tax=Malaciobacter molluscorum LMG 25693 TaxID=870501 RepID=A0A2G1DJK4_9BACT|nr:hypothetical protein [Malaciobacter molluscorum]AXX91680.1 CRISPR/Cas system-associated RAMP protein Cas6, type III [Malaciobacter molluscorum LMG 25693]PHO18526.1 hypothetical protein CPU12_04400 [Malaciobacter molluscorum LMG 25693]
MKYSKILFKLNSENKPAYFMGSEIRGTFGYGLKRVVCVNPSFECSDCFSKEQCIFYDFFEKKNVYHKYRFDIELNSDSYEFSIVLFSKACENIPYIISAFYETFTKIGFGKDRLKYEDFEIYLNSKKIYKDKKLKLPKKLTKKIKKTDDYHKSVVINIKTPLRIKKDSTYVYDERLDLHDILLSIYKRSISLKDKKFKRIELQDDYKIIDKTLCKRYIKRYSGIQKKSMNFNYSSNKLK